MSKTVKKIIISAIALLIIAITLFSVIMIDNYRNATEIAENNLAVYFSNKRDSFLSFEDVYTSVEAEGSVCYVKLSGSVNCYHTGAKQYTYPFTAEAEVDLITKECDITYASITKR